MDELDRATEQSTLGIDIFLPDLLRQEGRLAVGAEAAGHGHAVANLDRLLSPCRLEPGPNRNGECDEPRRSAYRSEPQDPHDAFPPLAASSSLAALLCSLVACPRS